MYLTNILQLIKLKYIEMSLKIYPLVFYLARIYLWRIHCIITFHYSFYIMMN